MDKQDKENVKRIAVRLEEEAKSWPYGVVQELLAIIGRLDAENVGGGIELRERYKLYAELATLRIDNTSLKSQLQTLKKVGKPFEEAAKRIGAPYPDYYRITVTHPKEGMDLCVGDYRALAAELEKVKDAD